MMNSRPKWKIILSITVMIIIFQRLVTFILRTSDQSGEKVFDQNHDLSSPTISEFLHNNDNNNDLESLDGDLNDLENAIQNVKRKT